MTIKSKLYIYFFGFSALLLGVLILFYQVSYNTLREKVVSGTKLIAMQISQKLHSNINFIEEDMRLFAISRNLEGAERDVALRNLPNTEMIRRRFITFFEIKHGYKLYDNIALYDITGNTLKSTCACVNPSSEKWWKEAVQDGVSYALVEDESGMSQVSIAILLKDINGESWGVMQGTIPISSLIRRGDLSLKGIGAYQVDIVAPDGRYLYSTALHSPGQISHKTDNVLNKPEKDDHVHTHNSGPKTLDILLPHKHGKRESLQWDLILHLDYNKTFASVLALRWWIGGSVFLILLVGGVSLMAINKSISRPLSNLATAAESFGSGNLSIRIKDQHNGEFQTLAHAFNVMAQNIEETQDKLELMVEDRTQSLSAANETLRQEIETRIQTQQAFEETSAILKAAMDCSTAGIAIADAPDGKLRYVNRAGLGIPTGTQNTLVDEVDINHYVEKWNILDFDGTPLSPEDIPLARAILYGETNDRQFIIERSDKEQRVVWAHAAPVLNDNGKVIAGVVIFPDITEVKKAEKILKESEERLQRIISVAPIPMWLVESDGRISFINNAFTKTLGYEMEDIPTMNTWWDQVYPDKSKRDRNKAIWKNIVEQANDHGLEIDPLYREVTRKDGSIRTVEFRVMPLGDTMVITMLDLTDQLRMVEELTANEALLAETQQIASLGSWKWEIATGDIKWSNEMYRIFGLKPDSNGMSYERFLDFVHPTDRQHVEESLRLALDGTAPYNIEHRIVLADGTIKTIHERGRVETDDAGTPLIMVGSAQDISELKEIESELIRASKMESIGQLAAGIAHEINTPAQFLQYNLKFFREGYDDLAVLLSEYHKLIEATVSEQSLQEIHKEIVRLTDSMDYDFLMDEIPKSLDQSLEGLDRIARIVQSIKQFAHTSLSDKLLVDVNQTIDTVITVSTNEWKYHSEVVLDLAKQLPKINCAPDLLNQALLNLVVNAAHANMEKVKSGALKKAGIYISTEYKDQSVIITIRDDGPGIPENLRDRIFDPFFTTKDVGKGTGQGLSIVQKAIVGEHGGSINVESEEGVGTTFIVRLPA